MSDLNIDPTEEVNAQEPTEALGDYNSLRQFARFWAVTVDDPDDIENEAVVVSTLFRAYIHNVKPEALGTNQIRVPFLEDRPPSLVIDGHLIQSIANADSAVITGSSGSKFIIANRSSSTFTITISTSSTVGDDQRCVGCFEWDGSAIVPGSITSYELTTTGGLTSLSDDIVKVWGEIATGGTITESFGLSSVSLLATGQYRLTFSRSFSSTNYAVAATPITASNVNITIVSQSISTVDIYLFNNAGSAISVAFTFMIIGRLI